MRFFACSTVIYDAAMAIAAIDEVLSLWAPAAGPPFAVCGRTGRPTHAGVVAVQQIGQHRAIGDKGVGQSRASDGDAAGSERTLIASMPKTTLPLAAANSIADVYDTPKTIAARTL